MIREAKPLAPSCLARRPVTAEWQTHIGKSGKLLKTIAGLSPDRLLRAVASKSAFQIENDWIVNRATHQAVRTVHRFVARRQKMIKNH